MNYYQSDSERSNLVLLQNSLEMELISNQCFVFKSFFFFFFYPCMFFGFACFFTSALGLFLTCALMHLLLCLLSCSVTLGVNLWCSSRSHPHMQETRSWFHA